jgi:uncharacterized RDD family membrane protein YckC
MKARYATVRVSTPEGVEFAFRVASPVLRMAALYLDWAVIAAAWSVLSATVGMLGMISKDVAIGASIVGYFVLARGYGVFCEWAWGGQTAGKRLLRLRVVDARGLRLTFVQCLLRNLLRFVDGLPLAYAVGGVAALLSARGQRLGDLVADTLVIHEPLEPTPTQVGLGELRYNSLRSQAAVVARLRREVTTDEARALWQALARREEMEPTARLSLYGELAAYYREKAHLPPALLEGLTDEQQLRNITEVLYREK